MTIILLRSIAGPEKRYGIGQTHSGLCILSPCCESDVTYNYSKRRVVCVDCTRDFAGWSDTIHDIGGDDMERWISAWTGIPQADIKVTVRES